MRRRRGDSIRIGDDVEVRILAIEGRKVKIGIVAPRAVAVTTQEVELVREANRAAAATPVSAAVALAEALRNRGDLAEEPICRLRR
jgi:carbon storage regulator